MPTRSGISAFQPVRSIVGLSTPSTRIRRQQRLVAPCVSTTSRSQKAGRRVSSISARQPDALSAFFLPVLCTDCPSRAAREGQSVQRTGKKKALRASGWRAEIEETRRPAFWLRDVVETQGATSRCWRRIRVDGVLKPTIERTGWNALIPDLVGIDDRLHQSVEAFTGEARDRHQRHTFELGQLFSGLFA